MSNYLIPELMFPLDQIDLYRNTDWKVVSREKGSARWVWHPLAFVRDIFRVLFLPVWLGLIVCIAVWLGALFLGYMVGGFLVFATGVLLQVLFSPLMTKSDAGSVSGG